MVTDSPAPGTSVTIIPGNAEDGSGKMPDPPDCETCKDCEQFVLVDIIATPPNTVHLLITVDGTDIVDGAIGSQTVRYLLNPDCGGNGDIVITDSSPENGAFLAAHALNCGGC